MKSRLILILTFLLVVGFGYYLVRPYISPSAKVKEEVVISNDNLIKISEERVLDYWINEIDRSLFYISETGVIYKLLPNSLEAEEIYDFKTRDLSLVKENSTGTRAALRVDNQWLVFGSENYERFFLPEDIASLDWSSDDSLVFYKKKRVGNSGGVFSFSLVTGKVSKISDFTSLDSDIFWVEDERLVFTSKPSSATTGLIQELLLDSGEVLTSVLEKNDIYSYPLFYRGGELFYLDILLPFKTIPDKCRVLDDFIFCGVGTNGVSDIDSYLTKEIYSSDQVVRYSLVSEELETTPLDIDVDTNHLKISGRSLYFINRLDGLLYELFLGPILLD